jgi:site-specific DNA-methyltransferase (adenine-specific)
LKRSVTHESVAKRKRAPRYQILCDDAFVWLEKRRANSVHAVVTDPPFGLIEFEPDQLQKRASGNGGIWRLPHNFDGHERRPTPRFTVLGPKEHLAIRRFHTKLSKGLLRILVPGGHVIIASQTLLAHHVISAFISTGFELRGQIARMVSTLRGGDRPKFAHTVYADLSVIPRSAWEPWLIFRKPCEGLVRDNLKKWKTGALRRPAKDKPFRDCIQSAPARGVERVLSDHPSLKPQKFMRQIVRAALPFGKGVVLDPFAGSGATLAAAESFGFRSIGIEINKEYAALARRIVPKLAYTNGDTPA